MIDAVDAAGGENSALTVGMPNVGKSTTLVALLRALGKKIQVGARSTGSTDRSGEGAT